MNVMPKVKVTCESHRSTHSNLAESFLPPKCLCVVTQVIVVEVRISISRGCSPDLLRALVIGGPVVTVKFTSRRECDWMKLMASNLMQHRMVRRPEVEEVTGLSRATLYRLIGKGLFPSPVKLGPNSVGWKVSAILEWLEGRESVGGPPNQSPTQDAGEPQVS